MNTFNNNFDELEQIIFEGGLRLVGIHFQKEVDLMMIVLNNKKVLTRQISKYKNLENASLDQLKNYRLISMGIGVHWPDLDEDLSLKGFLKEEISHLVVPDVF